MKPQTGKPKSRHTPMKLADIKANFFVRKGLNQDHVLMLAELYEAARIEHKDDILASKAVTIIEVTDDNILVDGRHRKEAMELAEIKVADVERVGILSPSELILRAMQANMGGALPPTRDDMVYSVDQLLHKGMSARAIEDALTIIPRSVVRRYISIAQRRRKEAAMKQAINDVASTGLTVRAAAQTYGVNEEELSAAIAGKKRKFTNEAGLLAPFSSLYNALGRKLGANMRRVFEQYRDGEVSHDAVRGLLNHVCDSTRKLMLRVQDWDNRLKANVSNPIEEPERSHNWRPVDKIAQERSGL